MIISIIGMPGCGKSSIGKTLAKQLNMNFIDVDQYIEENYDTIDNLFKISEEHFRKIESEALKACLSNDHTVLSTGGGIILAKENRDMLMNESFVVFIDRKVEDIVSSTDFSNRPLLKENVKKIYNLYENRIDKYNETAHVVIKSNNIFNDTIDKILQLIDNK